MSQHRLKKWNDRALAYVGMSGPQREKFRARFKKKEFDAALVRVGVRPEKQS